jgi:hypothetical protein
LRITDRIYVSLIKILTIFTLLLTSFSCSTIKQATRGPSSINPKSCNESIYAFFSDNNDYYRLYSQLTNSTNYESNGLYRFFDDYKLEKEFKSKIKKLSKNKKSIKKTRAIAHKLYLIVNSDESFFRSILDLPITKNKFLKSKEKLIQQKWEQELLSKDIFNAMEGLGLIKNPEDLVKEYTRSGDAKETMKSLFYFSFIFTPKISFTKNKFLDEKALNDLFKVYQKSNYNFESIYPELLKKYNKRANADTTMKLLRKTFNIATTAVVIYFVATEVAPWMIEDLPGIVENLPEILEQTFEYEIPKLREKFGIYSLAETEREQMEKELIDVYKEAYKAFRGKYPSEDNKKLIKLKEEYAALSDFNLSLEYDNAFSK